MEGNWKLCNQSVCLFFKKKLNICFFCVYVWVCTRYLVHVEDKGHPVGIGSPIHCGTSRDRTQAIRFGHYPQAFSPFTSVPVLIFQVMMPSFPSVIAFIFQYRFFYQLLSLYEGKYWHMAGFMFLCLYACWEELRCAFLTGKYKVWCFWEVGKGRVM